jgi:hypothetical protein
VSGGGGRKLLAESRLMPPLTDVGRDQSARLDAVALIHADTGYLRERLRRALKGVPDMPRALSRLSLNRGGPRDLWRHPCPGLKAATGDRGAGRSGDDAAEEAERGQHSRASTPPRDLRAACPRAR